MGSARRSNLRSRTTRSSKAKLLTDPTSSTAELQSQLRSLGLYAAPTVGDGNCLFRALSDQYYGSPSRHAQVRRDVCDWIAQHRERYEGFVDVDEFGSGKEGLEGYLRGMRENATYGGHMELSAFAHLTKRNIKVVQPGLVYVIQCESPKTSLAPTSIIKQEEDEQPMDLDGFNDRDRRRLRREKRRADDLEEEGEPPDGEHEDGTSGPTIYVAYHDWEHFSSIRNLRGPHVGLPCIQETQVSDEDGDIIPSSPAISKNAKKRELKNAMKRKTVAKVKLRLSHPSPADPSQVPLPVTPARSVSPVSTYTPPPPSTSPTPAPPNLNTLLPPARLQRSPKRSFDETSASGSSETTDTSKSQEEDEREGRAKRTRIIQTIIDDFDEPLSELSSSESEDDDDEQSPPRTTPSLSPASSAASSSESSSSRGSPAPVVGEKPMTRRQRKRLGLPKSRPSAGKIIIPGGRYVPRGGVQVNNADAEDEEWRRNGSGRVDVRGFRELKI
ncbi:cysteine proteinase [Armillaria solidipes]|uniref:Cysteine proteinase n=1 Tax=Armillaria solidipes TaxID=1076256 RepID=A0A2H3C2V7_9AGAR|nr:cysteine proteinase [Armillaria solidipes]